MPTLVDISGNGHDGTIFGSPESTVIAQHGEGLITDGVTDYVVIPDHANFNTINFSIAVLYSTVETVEQVFFANYQNNGTISGNRFGVNAAGKLYAKMGKNTGNVLSTDYEEAVGAVATNDGGMNFGILTYDGFNIRLYEEGLLVSTVPWVAGNVHSTDDTVVLWARSNDAGATFGLKFKGTKDDVKYFNRTLSPTEALSLHESIQSGFVAFDAAWLTSDDPTFVTPTPAKTVKQLVIYEDTGLETTSPLLLHIDEATILPKTTESGKDLEVLWQGKGIARL